jgi:hypothetical protein
MKNFKGLNMCVVCLLLLEACTIKFETPEPQESFSYNFQIKKVRKRNHFVETGDLQSTSMRAWAARVPHSSNNFVIQVTPVYPISASE